MSTVTLSAGNVEYSREKAAVEIDELIDALVQVREDGATHVVGLSGNYRGASYVRLGTDLGWEECVWCGERAGDEMGPLTREGDELYHAGCLDSAEQEMDRGLYHPEQVTR